jgi:hypothetical protein
MWKKLALLAAVAGTVSQVMRYWNHAGTKTVVQRKREARHAVQRWEDEGGNLHPAEMPQPATKARPRSRSASSAPAST